MNITLENNEINMAKSTKNTWRIITGSIPCEQSELDLGITLKGGQSFRWQEASDSKYRGVFSSSVWTLHQDLKTLHFTVHTSTLKTPAACKKKLKNYFRLDISLRENLEKWLKMDENFLKFSIQVKGVRVLNQETTENLFSFICSANNHIGRITRMIERMCENYGEELIEIDEKMYYDFPKIEKLAEEDVTSVLLKEGFGYRAKYINNSAKKLMELGGIKWLNKLHKNSGTSYDESREKLTILPGIGKKVADCICLMSLGHLEAIPVDTHIYQVAKEIYLTDLPKFSTSSNVYGRINVYFREIWGPLAGWAQTVVFCTRIRENKKGKSDIEVNGGYKKLKTV